MMTRPNAVRAWPAHVRGWLPWSPRSSSAVSSPPVHTKASLAGSGEVSGHAFVTQPGKPIWSERAYGPFAREGYTQNVVSYACIEMIASGVSHVGWRVLKTRRGGGVHELPATHALLKLMEAPNPFQGGADMWHALVAHMMIGGNAFVHAVGPHGQMPRELYVLRPDRVRVLAGSRGLPAGYRYQVGEQATNYLVDRATGQSRVLHLKTFHPLNDWYGLSPMEAAAYSIDQHNQAAAWNQSLLQNGARPSGALVVRGGKAEAGGAAESLSEDQYWRLKQQIDEQFSGHANAGRPLLLEGGLDWKEMSLSPRDMDFINTKNSAARDIALAFGVPPQLLGIPGDNTYANLAEARLALWEQTILPLVDRFTDALNGWLVPMFGDGLRLQYDTDRISALTLRRDKLWERLQNATFLNDDEKRAMLGIAPRQTPAAEGVAP